MRKVVFTIFAILFIPVLSWAHGFAGKRFFPTTLAIDDPFVSDEGSLLVNYTKEPGKGEEPPTKTTVISGEFSKRITPSLGISLGLDFRHLKLDDGRIKNGFGNLDLGAKYQLFTNAPHEFLLSFGVDSELGGTGSLSVGSESFSTISPALLFGKGFGDLPDSLKYLRPLAITGRFASNFPTRSKNVTTVVNHETGEIMQEVEKNPVTLSWGFTIQYSFPYLQSFVKDIGLGTPFNRMIILVEIPLETCLNRGCSGQTRGTVNPGLIWYGKFVQFGVEATIPVNERTGKNVGVFGLVHFFLDDIFPQSLGRPIFH
jgi:hypothetical protein